MSCADPLPDLPGISTFPELNVRLYVEAEGKPGVWFVSLDATNPRAVWEDNVAEDFYRYLDGLDVHALDCAGKVDLPTGMHRLEVLRRKLLERQPAHGIVRLLVDFRNTVWESVEDHMELSRVTREKFGLRPDNAAVRVAFVHGGRSGKIADNERWFSHNQEALDWLCETD